MPSPKLLIFDNAIYIHLGDQFSWSGSWIWKTGGAT